MTEETRKAIIEGLKNDLYNALDNLSRAKAAFGSRPDLLGDKYGQSDKTRQEIIDGYQRWYDKAEKALAEASIFVKLDEK